MQKRQEVRRVIREELTGEPEEAGEATEAYEAWYQVVFIVD